MVYADTSVLVSLYLLDVNTPRAVALVRSLTQPLVYSALHRLEIRNAFSLAIFRGHQSASQASVAWQHLEADIRNRVLLPVSLRWHAAFRRAAAIASSETPVLGTRTSISCTWGALGSLVPTASLRLTSDRPDWQCIWATQSVRSSMVLQARSPQWKSCEAGAARSSTRMG
jgi:hypothetical protein